MIKTVSIFVAFVAVLFLVFCGCNSEPLEVRHFESVRAYPLAQAVASEDLEWIEELVTADSSLLSVHEPVEGYDALFLRVDLESPAACQKLLELGADPNSINPHTRYSVLMTAIRPFGDQFDWRMDTQYANLLLEHGADPNYAVTEGFTNERGHYVRPSSPLMKASRLDPSFVRLLLKYGANPKQRVGGELPFAESISSASFEVMNYYIDSVGVDVRAPMHIRSSDSLYVGYYVRKYLGYEEGSENYRKTQRFIEHLEGQGVTSVRDTAKVEELKDNSISIAYGTNCHDDEVRSDIEFTVRNLSEALDSQQVEIVTTDRAEQCGYVISAPDTTVVINGSLTDVDILMILDSL